jgi:histidine triad (HIT) family protein
LGAKSAAFEEGRISPVQKADCIFCKIASGAIPSLRVLDTPDAIAFLDIGPLAPGHALLIPKQHFDSILDVPDEALHTLTSHLPPLGRAIMRATGATGLNVLQNTGESGGQLVFHLHFHLIPRRPGDSLGFRWNSRKYAAGEGEAVQTAILNELRK